MLLTKLDWPCSLRWAALLRAGVVVFAALAAPPAMAKDAAPAGSSSAQAANAPRDATASRPDDEALESITIIGGAVDDPREPRWGESDAKRPTLPLVAEDAFLDGEPLGAREAPPRR